LPTRSDHRGDVDDAAGALAKHRTDGGLGDEEDALEVGGEDVVPVLLAHAHDERVAGDAGVVDDDIEAAEALEGGLDGGGGALGGGDIGLQDLDADATAGEFGLGGASGLLITAVGEEEIEAIPGEALRNREADAARATGDDGGSVGGCFGHRWCSLRFDQSQCMQNY